MDFKYTSDEHAPKETVVFGYKFKLGGEPVEVTDEAHIAKFLGMAGFDEVKAKKAEPKQKTPSKKTAKK